MGFLGPRLMVSFGTFWDSWKMRNFEMGQVLDKGNNYYLLYCNSANGMTNLRHIFSKGGWSLIIVNNLQPRGFASCTVYTLNKNQFRKFISSENMYGIGNIWQNSTNEHETGTLSQLVWWIFSTSWNRGKYWDNRATPSFESSLLPETLQLRSFPDHPA